MPVGSLPRPELEQRGERPRRRIDPGADVAQPREPGRHRAQGEVGRVAGGELFPGDRRGDARVRCGPDRVRGRDGAVLRVLVVVDEDPVPLLFPPLARGQRGRATLDLARQGERRVANVRERPARLDAHVHVDPARAARLRPADEPVLPQDLIRHRRDAPDLVPPDAGDGIEVHAELVGVIQVGVPHRVRIQVDAAEVHHPRELRGVADDDLVRAPTRGELELHHVDPGRPRRRRALLEEELAPRAVDVALQRHGPIAHPAQRAVGHREVVPDELELRDAGLREVRLVRVRHRHLAAVDHQGLFLPGGHAGPRHRRRWAARAIASEVPPPERRGPRAARAP